MSYVCFKKALVVGIIIMFIGAGVIPVTGLINNNLNVIENHTSIRNNPQLSINSSNDEWNMFRNNVNRTGYSSSHAPQTNTVKWKIHISDSVGILSSPAIVNGKVYFGPDTHPPDRFLCFDAESGEQIWMAELPGGSSLCSPAVAEGKVFQTAIYDYFYCFNAENGGFLWKYYKDYGTTSMPAVANGKVYFVNNNLLICLDADNGDELWTHQGASEWCHPSVDDGKIYIGNGTKLKCLNASTGVKLWNSSINIEVSSAPAISNGKVYFSSRDGFIYCLDAENGEMIWNYMTWCITSSPAIAYGRVYHQSNDGNIYCFDAENGDLIWKSKLGSGCTGIQSPAVADGKIFAGVNNGKLLCLDAENGEILWDLKVGAHWWYWGCSPAIAYGNIYIGGGETDYFYCIGDPSKPPIQPTINGPIIGGPKLEAKFTIVTTDPEGYNVKYYIDWGDGTNSGWIGPHRSGMEIIVRHSWDELGSYNIRVKAKDRDGLESKWSTHKIDILDVPALKISKIKGGLLRATLLVKNVGTKDATDVKWNITLDGGFILRGHKSSGTVDYIAAGAEASIKSDFILGYGPTVVYADASVPFGISDARKQNGFIFGFFIFVRFGEL